MGFRPAVALSVVGVLYVCVGCSSGGLDAGTTPETVDHPRVPRALGTNVDGPAWSPDGNAIVFAYVADSDEEFVLGHTQLWTYSLEDGRFSFLTPGHSACWSPSGESIAYTFESSLWIFDLDTRTRREVTDFAPVFQPRWSPSGDRILFMAWTPSQGLWTIAPDGGDLREIGIPSFSADWSPDGNSIVFNSASLEELATMELATGTPEFLVDVRPMLCAYPRWSPLGDRIAYYRYGPDQGIWMVGADGSRAHLAIPGGKASHWSPDGSQLVYERLNPSDYVGPFPPNDTYALWVFSALTGNSVPLFGAAPPRL